MDWLIGISPILLIVLICPLVMFFMMRGMHGGHGEAGTQAGPHAGHDEAQRLTELEEEVARLRQENDARIAAVSASKRGSGT